MGNRAGQRAAGERGRGGEKGRKEREREVCFAVEPREELAHSGTSGLAQPRRREWWEEADERGG